MSSPYLYQTGEKLTYMMENISMYDLDKEDTTDWRAVAENFYHACGGKDGCGDPDCVEAMCARWGYAFEDKEEDTDVHV